ncbi:MAG: adenylyl-sulfate kinase [Myxococcales bacterium]
MSGAVVWMTGLPSSGKSTLARVLLERLHEAGVGAALLDGDEVREAIVPTLGYTPAARDAFYLSLARFAALLARQGLVVIVAATAHRRAWRAEARGLAPDFFEVHLDVPLEECTRRDPKGLHARAARGEMAGVPGWDVSYQVPEAPEFVAHGGRDAAALEQIVARLQAGRRLRR